MKSRSSFGEFLHYATLNMLGMVGISCYILADTYFIASGLGNLGLTALNLAIPLYSLMYGIGLMLGIGGATRYSILMGQGKRQEGSRVFTTTMIIGAGISALLMFTGIFFAKELAVLAGADKEVIAMTTTYLRVLWCASPLFIFNNIIIAFIRNDNAPSIAMAGMITGSLMNVLLDYIFIFPLNMGMFGAILATAMSPGISLLIMSVHFVRKKNEFHLTRKLNIKKHTVKILSAGFTSFINEVSSGVVIMVFNLVLIGISGNIGVAAYGIIANVSIVVIAVYNGIAQGIQPIVSRDYGLQNYTKMKTTLKYAIISATVVSLLIYALMYFGAETVSSIFNSENNPELNSIAISGIRIYFTGCLFAGLNIILSVYLAAADRAKYAGIISVCRGFAVITPITLLLSYISGITGLWLAFPVAEGIVLVVSLVCVKLSDADPDKNYD